VLKEFDDKRAVLLLGLFVAFLLLRTTLFYPVQLFVTLLHEIGHGLGALLTGGSIDHIEVHANLGGLCFTRGGWRLVILPAGYLGSTLFGAAILWTACRTRYDRAASVVLGGGLLLMTVLFVRTLTGVLGGLAYGALLVVSGLKLHEDFNDLLLSFLGLASLSYALWDVKLLLDPAVRSRSDAQMLSEIIPLPALVWAGLWLLVAGLIAALVLRSAVRRSER